MIDIERDIKLAKTGKGDLIYKTLVGLKSDLSKPIDTPEILNERSKKINNIEEKDNLSEKSSNSEDSEENIQNESKFVNSARPRYESPDSKKVR